MAEAAKFKKIDKVYVLSDSSLNVYGYRLLTEGFQKDLFLKNPIGFFMHNRDEGVIVKWEDLVIEDDMIKATPVINLANKRGQQTVDEVENGFLNGASCGRIVVLDFSDDDSLKLPGQSGPTITKWYPKEVTLCDLPGNENSLSLFYEDGQQLDLADFNNKNLNMKVINLTPALLKVLDLTDSADQVKFEQVISDLVDKNKQVADLTVQANAAELARKTAEESLASLKATVTSEKVNDLLDKALNVDKKITVEVKEKLQKQFATDPTSLKDLLDVMPNFQSVNGKISEAAGKTATDLSSKSWNELDKAGKLEDLKANDPETYKTKFKEQFGTEPNA
jgi:hypothetical protein